VHEDLPLDSNYCPYLNPALRALLGGLTTLLLVACVRTGPPLAPRPLPTSAPDLETVLHDLAANDKALRAFHASGEAIVASRHLEAIQRLPNSSLTYDRSDGLYLIGRKYGGMRLFELVCDSRRCLTLFPTEKIYELLSLEESAQRHGFDASPIDVAQELLFPEQWAKLSRGQLLLSDYRETAGEHHAQLQVQTGEGRLRRQVELLNSEATAGRWVARQSTRYAENSEEVLAVTEKRDYALVADVLFPRFLRADFPTQNSSIQFRIRRLDINDDAPAEPIPDVAQLLGRIAADYERIMTETQP